jgi:hypothetical protein
MDAQAAGQAQARAQEQALPAMPPAGESPEFDADDLYRELRQRKLPPAAGPVAVLPEVAEPEPAPARALTIGEQLAATPAPAVGVLSLDPSGLPNVLAEFSGTGLYSSPDRSSTKAIVVSVDREPIGRYVAAVTRPGERWQSQSQAFTPPMGDRDGAAARRWLRLVAEGLRAAPAFRQLPLLIVLSAEVELGAGLDELARAANALVAKVEPGAEGWRPTLLERLSEPEPAVAAPSKASGAHPRRKPAGGVIGWLAGVAEQLHGHPESIPSPLGPVAVSYGGRDGRGEYAVLRAAVERGGRLMPAVVELAPSVEVDLSEVRVYI